MLLVVGDWQSVPRKRAFQTTYPEDPGGLAFIRRTMERERFSLENAPSISSLLLPLRTLLARPFRFISDNHGLSQRNRSSRRRHRRRPHEPDGARSRERLRSSRRQLHQVRRPPLVVLRGESLLRIWPGPSLPSLGGSGVERPRDVPWTLRAHSLRASVHGQMSFWLYLSSSILSRTLLVLCSLPSQTMILST